MKLQSGRKFRNDGDAARDNKDWEGAAQNYRRYLDVSPDDADIWVQLGHVLKEQGELLEAESAYRKAATLAPASADARLHLAHLLKRLDRPKQAAAVFQQIMTIAPTAEVIDELKGLGYGDKAQSLIENAPVTKTTNGRYLELRDLFGYLSQHTTVTGITRVVLGLVHYVLEDMDDDEASSYFFVQQYGDAEGLLLLPKLKLRRLVQLATSETADLPTMLDVIAEIRRSSSLMQLKAGDLYFIPGAFWDFVTNPSWLSSMKQKGVYVGAYIYDLIPITHAHYCMAELTDAFNVAFSETSRFVDFTLTISEFVAQQVTDFLSAHHIAPFPAIAVPLAHELHFDAQGASPTFAEPMAAAVQALEDRAFVLCVCTIEARKNHIYLFYIWQQMIDAGIDVPDLVFVGRHGWRVHDLLSQIAASRNLGGRLHVMHGLSDADLGRLYARCLFTVFPSFVEGWGLPVGESLAYGKLCVASSATSIPEVGGKFAIYVDPFNMTSGYEVIHRLITEPTYLASLEAKIRREFVPRTWRDVGRDFYRSIDRALASVPRPEPGAPGFAPFIKAGTMLGMAAVQQAGTLLAEYAENPTRLLFVNGWRGVEATGTWMKDSHAKLRVRCDYEVGREVSVLLQLSTSPWVDEKNIMRVWASDAPLKRNAIEGETLYTQPMQRDSRFWIRLKAAVEPQNLITIQFRVDGAVVASDPNAIPVALRFHALGFSATNDISARMDLLEQATLAIH
jgi:tetratricopeptide (TPR) repeat protein